MSTKYTIKTLALCIYISLSMNLGAQELDFLKADGTQYDASQVPNMIVTEHLKQQAKLIQKGKVIKRFASYGKCQEAWQTPESTIVCGSLGIWKYDQTNTREIYFEPQLRILEIHSCEPLSNGDMLVAANKSILEISPNGKIKKSIKLDFLREESRLQIKSIKKLADGGYLISSCGPNKIYRLDKKGWVKRVIELNLIKATVVTDRIHDVELLKNGRIMISTGFGASLIEVNENDEITWSLKQQDQEELGLVYLGGFIVRDNGNIIATAYKSKYPMFEITREKNLVWKLRRNKDTGLDKPSSLNLVTANLSPSME
ncbi:hypothetical protein PQO03_16635 [Lentisphaera profundi]|uniref:Uncharacterized protein n=1 Tax=Lentisphaera profundi TaxID=1658616 RepID=A0ABY7VZ50_9BACT|nr:hypothetical protein [Lentisphaera profundi]WDE99465.1 hypothetical protein PQO03_16635 [Lentisphaera profundi]